MADAAKKLATFVDIGHLDGEKPAYEVVRGVVVRKAAAKFPHAHAARSLSARLDPYGVRGDGGGLGGWWIVGETDIEFTPHEVYVPDMSGWRRERVPRLPDEWPLTVRPDWVCEILSPSTRDRDLVAKLQTYQSCGVSHYWALDSVSKTLHVYRNGPDGFVLALSADASETVRAEPFDGIEFFIGGLFGEEPDPSEGDPDET